MWAVLSNPGKRFGRWQPDEFFAAGHAEIGTVLTLAEDALRAAGRPAPARRRALDFGCGVGRLSQALGEKFDEVDGVDIAESMLAGARRYNRHGDRCHYHLNTADDLALFPADRFDFLYTAHVLQHMEPRYAERYVQEFFRVLAPGGVAVFEMTTELVRGAEAPLPDGAFRAGLTIERAPAMARPGGLVLVTVRATNEGDTAWPAAGADGWYLVTLGNHWLSDTGQLLITDDGRTRLPADLPPGASVTLEVEATAPATPGHYRCEVDLVQEGVAWFADRGSTPVSTAIRIAAPGRLDAARGSLGRLLPLVRRGVQPGQPAPATEPDGPPVMEMYGVPEAEITGWVEAAGGSVISVTDWDELFGQRAYDWQRRIFVAVKPAAP